MKLIFLEVENEATNDAAELKNAVSSMALSKIWDVGSIASEKCS